jgi:hypothetical protein
MITECYWMLLSHLVLQYRITECDSEFDIVLQVLYQWTVSSLNTYPTSVPIPYTRVSSGLSRATMYQVLASVLLTLLVRDSSYVADVSKSMDDHLTDEEGKQQGPTFPRNFSRRFTRELAFLAPTKRTIRKQRRKPSGQRNVSSALRGRRDMQSVPRNDQRLYDDDGYKNPFSLISIN